VNAKDIERFTEISGDRNPLHYDEAVAKASRFGEIVVQGGITSAILNAVVAEDLPGPWHRIPAGELELQGTRAAR
jgi:acyl dehydratase